MGQAQAGPLCPLTLLGGLAYLPILPVWKIRFGVGSRGGESHLLIAPGLVGFLTSWHLVPERTCWVKVPSSSPYPSPLPYMQAPFFLKISRERIT